MLNAPGTGRLKQMYDHLLSIATCDALSWPRRRMSGAQRERATVAAAVGRRGTAATGSGCSARISRYRTARMWWRRSRCDATRAGVSPCRPRPSRRRLLQWGRDTCRDGQWGRDRWRGGQCGRDRWRGGQWGRDRWRGGKWGRDRWRAWGGGGVAGGGAANGGRDRWRAGQ